MSKCKECGQNVVGLITKDFKRFKLVLEDEDLFLVYTDRNGKCWDILHVLSTGVLDRYERVNTTDLKVDVKGKILIK